MVVRFIGAVPVLERNPGQDGMGYIWAVVKNRKRIHRMFNFFDFSIDCEQVDCSN